MLASGYEGGEIVASTLLERRLLCQDRLFRERMAQALLESGKSVSVDVALGKCVAALETAKVDLSGPVDDARIVEFVGTLSVEGVA